MFDAAGQHAGRTCGDALRKVETSQPEEDLRHAVEAGDHLQGLAGVLPGSDGAVGSHPGGLGVVDLGEGGGGCMVGAGEEPAEGPPRPAAGAADG